VLNQRVTGKFPTISDRLRRPKKKTAAQGVGTRDGGNLVEKLAKTSRAQFRAKAPRLTSVRLVPCYNDAGGIFGWEMAR
jgi:hypothetical protein